MSESSSELLRVGQLGKSFPGVRALEAVDLTLRAGEIHALMGENGAGKSTLIKVLTGVYPRDNGKITLGGHDISPSSPREAENNGISTVYQEVNLIPTLSVAENILLGRQPRRWGLIQWRTMRGRAEAALQRLGLHLDVTRDLNSYSMAIQQMVAIARALDVRAKLLILDEPTSSLDEQECAALFELMRRLRDQGLAMLFVTHFLDQVYEVTDRITVLRNGRLVGEFETSRLPRLRLIGKMLGKVVDETSANDESIPSSGISNNAGNNQEQETAMPEDSKLKKVVLQADGIGRSGNLKPLSLAVRKGEVLGLAGLLGSGRTETARLLFGIDRRDEGRLWIEGREVPMRSPREAIGHGLAYCSEDRKTEGIAPNLSVCENLILAMQASRGPLRRLSRAEQINLADHYIKLLNIKAPGTDTPLRNLSGGNQQKVLLARWLALQPKLIILDEPTRGIDVGAKAEIEKLVESLCQQGMSVVFISSELDEIIRVSQRVVVLRDRRKVGELDGKFNEPAIMNLIAQPHE